MKFAVTLLQLIHCLLTTKKVLVSVMLISLGAVTGCATNRHMSIPVSTGLLQKHSVAAPLVDESFEVNVIDNYSVRSPYRLEEALQSALQNALSYSNIFSRNPNKSYEILAKVKSWNQPAADFGMFASEIQVRYQVFDADDNLILDQTISAAGSSDRWSFMGQSRARRAAIVCVSENVNTFIKTLKHQLETNISE